VQCVGFTWLAVYLDAVLADANGVCLPPWFFLLPSYWGLGTGVSEDAVAGWHVLLSSSANQQGAA
jgi:hypothetical protein